MRLLGCILLALAALAASAADVYRSTDANGVVTYSDRPQDSRAVRVVVVAPRGSTRPAEPPAPAVAAAQDGRAGQAEPAAAPGGEATEPEQTPEERAEVRARNCEIARERARRYAESHRLYRSLPDGGREYLTDQQIDEARARAAADVETWCS